MAVLNGSLLFLMATLPAITTSASIHPLLGPQNAGVGSQSTALTDLERIDPFNNRTARSLMVSSFYPVTRCNQKEIEKYMPPATGFFMDKKFSAYGLPNGSFQSLTIESCNKGAGSSISHPKALPLVLFSGALGTSRHLYNALLQNVAASGYLVVSIDHPYDADVVEFPNGSVIYGIDISDNDLGRALDVRVDDIAFVLRQLSNVTVAKQLFTQAIPSASLRNTAMFGHSFGGAATAAAMLKLPTLKGGLNLDGTMFGPVLTTGLTRPLMLVGHENKTRETDPSWSAIWPNLKGWHREYEVRNTAHYSFSDLPLITSVLGLQSVLPVQVQDLLGKIDGERMMRLTATYVTAFFDMVLRSGNEKLLAAAGRQFSEARILC